MRSVKDDLFLIGELDISAAGPRCKMLLGDLDGDGRMEIVMVQPDNRQDVRYIPHQVQCVTVFDLEGKLLWQTGTPDPGAGGPGSDYPVQIYDLDGDGSLEVLCVMNDRFHILDGQSGKVKRSFELPDPQAHDCIIIANLTGGDRPSDLILKDRYHRMWALNSEFELLWTHAGNPGHYPWPVDLNRDGYDEVMAGYDLLNHKGERLWSCRDLDDHADCIWIGDVNGDGQPELVIGGSVTVMYDSHGQELWRYEGSVESQHVALGKFRDDLPGLQVAGLDRIVRGDGAGKRKGKDGMFLLDSEGKEVWKEDRQTDGWLTIIETVSRWDDSSMDYILAYRRGGGDLPALYDGYMNMVVQFPTDGYVTHADLLGSGKEQVIIYDHTKASIYSSSDYDVAVSVAGNALPHSKRLYHSTLYPGGEI
ncbi:FG-GAP-like repeat-containing protein [Paenibacillus sp. UNC451MF]|uniref:FG-GAP-like repeat-containing protein n=1 Tax=Paenibacillus sp. UNC451MF TaxID=1449063 RepID=UPI00048ECA14|nr:FG-GAP-like repeat-containing protein [Paenibacillus sp. UNC451MF]